MHVIKPNFSTHLWDNGCSRVRGGVLFKYWCLRKWWNNSHTYNFHVVLNGSYNKLFRNIRDNKLWVLKIKEPCHLSGLENQME